MGTSDHQDAVTVARTSTLGVSGKSEVLDGNATCASIRMKVKYHLIYYVADTGVNIPPPKHHPSKCVLILLAVHTDYYSPIDSAFRRVDHEARPELNRGTIDFVVPKEYHALNAPKRLLHSFQSPDPPLPDESTRPPAPMNYVFLIDVSYEAVVSGMVSSACTGILQALYGTEGEASGCWLAASKLAIITFDRVLHFYDISVSLDTLNSARALVTLISFQPHLSQAAIRVVPDIDEVYPPGRDDLFADPAESRYATPLFSSTDCRGHSYLQAHSRATPSLYSAYIL